VQTLQVVEVKLADKQADVNSPLYSAKTFEALGLDERLLKGLYAMKFVKPSAVQERALPLLLASPPQNMIAQSQSGTGKTAAFALAMLSRVDPAVGAIQAVCVVPTRELARQIQDVVATMGQFTEVRVDLALREEAGPRRSPLACHILIGTPGTILALEGKRLADLSQVRLFVLDEADVMLDKQGMGLQSLRVRNACPEDAQLVLFSATFSESVIDFAHRVIPAANEITLRREDLSIEGIRQFYMDCDSYPHKRQVLSALYSLLTIGQSIVFIATKASAEEIRAQMAAEGHAVSLLHGDMTPAQRDAVIDEFRRGQTKVLLTTNVLARGLDVSQVSLVVNFDLPFITDPESGAKYPDPETYLHRIGRTGRFGRTGVAINLVHNQQSMDAMLAIQDFYGRPIVHIPTHDFDALEAKLAAL
jgi:ATP-dependent RNA helicase DDX19/DBP5